MVSVLFLTLSGVTPLLLEATAGYAVYPQCSDAIDNDANGRMDFPQDPTCDSLDDPYEGQGQSPVFISITDGRDGVRAGDSLIYIITITQDREDVKVLPVELNVPAQVDIRTASHGGQITEQHVSWDPLAVSRGQPLKLEVQARVRTTAPLNHLIPARVSADRHTVTDVTVVTEATSFATPMFAVAITDNVEYISTQETLTYTITSDNLTGDERSTRVMALIPSSVILTGIPEGAVYEGHKLIWNPATFRPHERRHFTFQVRVPERRQDYLQIITQATTDGVSSSDRTIIKTGFPDNGIDTSMSSDRAEAMPGDVVTFFATVRNTTPQTASTVALDTSIPLYGEFVAANDGGQWDGRAVHWRNIIIAAGAERTLAYDVRVRPDAPIGSKFRATATAGNVQDATFVNIVPHLTPEKEPKTKTTRFTSTLLRKVADRTEVMPGGQIAYTIIVKNVLLHPISDAVVNDEFDASLMSVVDGGNALTIRPGHLQWNVPVLQPGETWKVRYTMTVSQSAKTGTIFNNIARISGSDVEEASFQERVSLARGGVLTELPPTGAPLDVLIAFGLSPLALAAAIVQRKLRIG